MLICCVLTSVESLSDKWSVLTMCLCWVLFYQFLVSTYFFSFQSYCGFSKRSLWTWNCKFWWYRTNLRLLENSYLEMQSCCTCCLTNALEGVTKKELGSSQRFPWVLHGLVFGSKEATVRSCQQLPPCPTEPFPDPDGHAAGQSWERLVMPLWEQI